MGYIGMECARCSNVSRFTFSCIETIKYDITFDDKGEINKLDRLDCSGYSRQMIAHVSCVRCGYTAPPSFFNLMESPNVSIKVDDRGRYAREANLHRSGCEFTGVRTYFKSAQEASIALDLAKLKDVVSLSGLPEFMTSESQVIRMAAQRKYNLLYRLTHKPMFFRKEDLREDGWIYNG